jgi:hypothetical protein
MNDTNRDETEGLSDLRLPELQARYAEVVGETTRCPNKQWLVRRIREAMAQTEEETQPEPGPEDRPDESGSNDRPLRKLSVAELQARHLEVIGRPTGSSNVCYLRWRLRQAERGRIRIGGESRPCRGGRAADFKVLPFRMETTVVARLDEARDRLGLGSRTELLRRALHDYLSGAGEREVAELLLPDGTA